MTTADSQRAGSGRPECHPSSLGPVVHLQYPEHLPADDPESSNVITEGDGSYLEFKETKKYSRFLRHLSKMITIILAWICLFVNTQLLENLQHVSIPVLESRELHLCKCPFSPPPGATCLSCLSDVWSLALQSPPCVQEPAGASCAPTGGEARGRTEAAARSASPPSGSAPGAQALPSLTSAGLVRQAGPRGPWAAQSVAGAPWARVPLPGAPHSRDMWVPAPMKSGLPQLLFCASA